MPMTFAHPAAVVPLARVLGRRVSLSALMIGSMMPDATYFVPLPVDRGLTHSLAGLFLFCLPMGWFAWLLFHRVLKGPLLELLPGAVSRRLPSGEARRIPDYGPGVLLASLLLGALTHLVWDAFTHEGPAMRVLPWLADTAFTVGGSPVEWHKLLQHASTLLGVSLLAGWTRDWLRRTPPRPDAVLPVRGRATRLAMVVGLPLGFALLGGLAALPESGLDVAAFRAYVGASARLGVTAFSLAVIGYCCVWQWRARRVARAG